MRSTIERPKPKPARDLGALVEAVKLLEDVAPFFDCGMPSAGVVDVDAQRRRGAGSRPARGPAGVYLIALETRFCSSRRSRRRSDCTAQRAGHERELEPLLARQRREFDLELAQQLVDAEARRFPASSRRCRAAKCRAARRRFPRPPRARRRYCRPAGRPRRRPAARPGW